MDLGTEINDNIKASIKTKLQELGSYIDDELPEYIMVMIANKRSQYQMTEDLSLFLGDETDKFVIWVFEMMEKLLSVMKGPEAKNTAEASAAVTATKQEPQDANESSQPVSSGQKSSRKEKRREDRDVSRGSKHIKKRHHAGEAVKEEDDDETAHATVRSTVEALTRRSAMLPASQQASGSLLRRAMAEAKNSVSGKMSSEYNPADVDPSNWTTDKELKKKQKALYLEHHKELQQLHNKNEVAEVKITIDTEKNAPPDEDEDNDDEDNADDEGNTVDDEGIELEVAENEFQEEKRVDLDGSHRIVAYPGASQEDDANSSPDESKHSKSRQRHKHKKGSKQRERKRSQPTFVVTLDGAASALTQKYDTEEVQEKRRRTHSKTEGDDSLVVDLTANSSRPSIHSRLQFAPPPCFPVRDNFYPSPLESAYHSGFGIGFAGGPQFGAFQGQPIIMPQVQLPMHPMVTGASLQGQLPAFSTYQTALPPPENIVFPPPENAVFPRPEMAVVPPPTTTITTKKGPIASRLSGTPVVEKVRISLEENGSDDEPMDVSVGTNGENGDEDTTDGTQQPLERCRFWPDCKNGDSCSYIHPSVPCKSFPGCKFGNQCIFLHPVCRFDGRCGNVKCPYTHSVKQRSTSFSTPLAVPPPTPSSLQCKFFPNCTKRNCPFVHPSSSSSKPCRYGAMCTNKACTFSHVAPKRASRSMTWIAPVAAVAPVAQSEHISDRPFVIDDDDGATVKVEVKVEPDAADELRITHTIEPEKFSPPSAPVIEVEN